MIVNLYVAVDLAIALFALAVGCFAALKAYKVEEGIKGASADQRYELEKDFYLVSTVGWMTLGTRISCNSSILDHRRIINSFCSWCNV